MRLAALALIVATIVAQVTWAIDGNSPKQYVIHTEFKQGSRKDDSDTVEVFAAPQVAVIAGHEANYRVGGEATLGDQQIPYGTALNLRIKPSGDEKVLITGVMDVSQITLSSDSVVARKSTCIHFKQTTPLNKPVRFALPNDSGEQQELTISIEEAK
jgi:hypothetical protein